MTQEFRLLTIFDSPALGGILMIERMVLNLI